MFNRRSTLKTELERKARRVQELEGQIQACLDAAENIRAELAAQRQRAIIAESAAKDGDRLRAEQLNELADVAGFGVDDIVTMPQLIERLRGVGRARLQLEAILEGRDLLKELQDSKDTSAMLAQRLHDAGELCADDSERW